MVLTIVGTIGKKAGQMKTKSELLLYRLSWTFDVIMSPTWRNLNDSFESWAYRNGCLRQIQSLEAHEFVESMPQVGEGGNRVYRLTELGMLTALGGRDPDVEWSRKWDEQWRMVIFDVPETARHKREVLRMALRKLHFGCLQRSVWISPHPVAGVEHEMKRLKVDAASLVLIDGKTCAGETANTVHLANHDDGIAFSGGGFGALLADREFGPPLLLDTSLGASSATAAGFGIADVLAHPREYAGSGLRG